MGGNETLKRTTDMNKPIDHEAFLRAFDEALPDHEKAINAKGEKLGLAAIDPGALIGGFCKAWPTIKAVLTVALPFVAWIPGLGPSAVAKVKAFETAFETTILPTICPTP